MMEASPMTTTEIYGPLTAYAKECVHFAVQHWRATLLCFPYLCVRTACRRARACSADPNICMSRLGPLVSEDVRKVSMRWCGDTSTVSPTTRCEPVCHSRSAPSRNGTRRSVNPYGSRRSSHCRGPKKRHLPPRNREAFGELPHFISGAAWRYHELSKWGEPDTIRGA